MNTMIGSVVAKFGASTLVAPNVNVDPIAKRIDVIGVVVIAVVFHHSFDARDNNSDQQNQHDKCIGEVVPDAVEKQPAVTWKAVSWLPCHDVNLRVQPSHKRGDSSRYGRHNRTDNGFPVGC